MASTGKRPRKRVTENKPVVKVGDCVLIRPGKANKNPHVARVEEIEPGNKKIRIRLYYSPEETKRGRRQFQGAREVFLSDHYDHQSVDVINGKCRIRTLDEYLSLESVRPEDYYWSICARSCCS